MRKPLLFALFCICQIAFAAHNSASAQDSNQSELEPASSVTDQEAQDDGSDLIAAEIDEAIEGEEESSTRFIPTEEISQDLGVSFPIDI